MLLRGLTRAAEWEEQGSGVGAAGADPCFERCHRAEWTPWNPRDLDFAAFSFLIRFRAAQFEAHELREEPHLAEIEAGQLRGTPAGRKADQEERAVASVDRQVAEGRDGGAELLRREGFLGAGLLIVLAGGAGESAPDKCCNRMIEIERAVFVSDRRADMFQVIKFVRWLTFLDAPGDEERHGVGGSRQRLPAGVVTPTLENAPRNRVAALGVLRLCMPHQILSRGAQLRQIDYSIEQRKLFAHCNLAKVRSTHDRRHETTVHLTIVGWE